MLAGRADDRLLDTYEAERRPYARRVIQLARTDRPRDDRAAATWTSALRDRLLPLIDQTGWLKQRMVRQSFAPFPGRAARPGRGSRRVAAATRARPDPTAPPAASTISSAPASASSSRGADVAGDEDHPFWTALDTRIVTAGPRLGEWLAAQGASAALVRPDRVILALAPRADLAAWRGALEDAGVGGAP